MKLQDVGERIRRERVRMNMTQTQLAEKSGILLPILRMIEDGKLMPALSTAVSLMKALGISAHELLTEKEKKILLGEKSISQWEDEPSNAENSFWWESSQSVKDKN